MNAPSEYPNVNIAELAQVSVFMGPQRCLQVGQLWKKQTVVLIFLRHFACIACRAHASQVWAQRHKLQASGARLVFIGNGQPHWIENFRLDMGIDEGIVLTDPSMRSFEAAGMHHGVFRLLRPKSAINMRKLAQQGYTQGPLTSDSGSHFQMGGVLAVGTDAKVRYHFASEAVGDFPKEPYLDVIAGDETLV